MTTIQLRDQRFFLFYTIGLFTVVFLAFAPGFMHAESRGLPFYMHVHGAVLVGWFLILIFQSLLVSTNNTRLHMKLGVFAAIYGYLLAPGALLATFNVVTRNASIGITLDTNMSDVNPALGAGMTFLEIVTEVVWTNIMAVCTFVILLTIALITRKSPDIHKRLLVLATVSIMGPAMARLSRFEFLGGEQGPFIPLALGTLLLILFTYDFVSMKKIHKASWITAIFMIAMNGLGFYISGTEAGLDFVRSLA